MIFGLGLRLDNHWTRTQFGLGLARGAIQIKSRGSEMGSWTARRSSPPSSGPRSSTGIAAAASVFIYHKSRLIKTNGIFRELWKLVIFVVFLAILVLGILCSHVLLDRRPRPLDAVHCRAVVLESRSCGLACRIDYRLAPAWLYLNRAPANPNWRMRAVTSDAIDNESTLYMGFVETSSILKHVWSDWDVGCQRGRVTRSEKWLKLLHTQQIPDSALRFQPGIRKPRRFSSWTE